MQNMTKQTRQMVNEYIHSKILLEKRLEVLNNKLKEHRFSNVWKEKEIIFDCIRDLDFGMSIMIGGQGWGSRNEILETLAKKFGV
jgi:hypothetical protein